MTEPLVDVAPGIEFAEPSKKSTPERVSGDPGAGTAVAPVSNRKPTVIGLAKKPEAAKPVHNAVPTVFTWQEMAASELMISGCGAVPVGKPRSALLYVNVNWRPATVDAGKVIVAVETWFVVLTTAVVLSTTIDCPKAAEESIETARAATILLGTLIFFIRTLRPRKNKTSRRFR
ncbi:MAG: hypothetical protein J0L65_03315 [Xanthomonadales bacterium]|nr:hypothetical protein [Xanthomonadales bacterium]